MDGLGLESLVEDSGLKSSVEELVNSETQYVIELKLLVGQEAVSVHSSEEGSAFEQSSGIFLLQSEELSCSLSELGKSKMHSPDFSLVFKTILSDKLKLVVDSFLFERSSWGIEG